MEKRPNHRPPKARIISSEADLSQPFFTTSEVAALLKLHENTIRHMIASGELPAKKFGKQWRIKSSDLQNFIK